MGFKDGGYFASTWLWVALAFGATAGIGFLVRGLPPIRPLGWLSLGALAALALWMLCSSVWGIAGTEAAREAGRASVYVAGLAAFLVLVDRRLARSFLVGLLGGILTLESHALGERVIAPRAPDPFQGTLLVGPLGYANALGILAAIGVLLAVGLCLSESHLVGKSLFGAAAFMSGVVLTLTSSRGAFVSLAVAAFVFAALRHRQRRVVVRRRWWAIVAFAVAVAVAWVGGSSLSLGHRPAYWQVALADAGSHPVLGSGAGSFDDFWLANRPLAVDVRDAHSLYLEVLAELGPIGLVLLLGALVPPLVAIVRAQDRDIVPVAAAGYVAFLVHAGLDWDWEMPATTLAGLGCGVALLVSARSDGSEGRRLSVS